MRIADLKIENFRGIKKANIRFGRHTVFVGANNSGKTTIIESLALLFGRDRQVRDLTEHDFFGSNPAPQDRIKLRATIVDFPGNDPAQSPQWFRDGRAVEHWYDEHNGTLHPSQVDPSWKLACTIGFCAYFNRSALEVETQRYFYDYGDQDDPFSDDTDVTTFPSELVRDLGFFLLPANRTWDRVISFTSELFKRVVSSSDGKPAESVLLERDRLRSPDSALEADPHLAGIVTTLDQELAGFFLEQPALKLRLTTTDSEGVLAAVVAHFGGAGGILPLPARRHGSGLISLQSLLLLMQFGRQRAKDGLNFWMALEEPELHVPPPLQRRLVHRLQALSSQTVVSTHSPMVASMSAPGTVFILRNVDGNVTSTQLHSDPLPASTPNPIRTLFQLRRVETISALMHDAVIIPEGRIDYEWLNLLVRAVDAAQGWAPNTESNFGTHVGIIPTQDAAVVKTFEALSLLHPRMVALVDGDGAGDEYKSQLLSSKARPSAIISWQKSWSIEDAIGWVLRADSTAVMSTIAALFDACAPSVDELVEKLKQTRKEDDQGLKGDYLAYESIADAIATVDACRQRARELLNAVCEVALGGTSSLFACRKVGDTQVGVFQG